MPNLIVGLGVAMPAFAEVAGDTFPSNGYMLENKTYANAATYGNIGAYDGAVTATAEYEDILYQIGAGTYLPAGATVAEQCPANSYCPGVTNATYNETASQGVSSCPSGYPNSDAGASSNTQCYTACTVNSANIEHATAVDGNDYYGTGTDTCAATACENGYHVDAIEIDFSKDGVKYSYINSDAVANENPWLEGVQSPEYFGLTNANTWATEFDYGTIYGRATCQSQWHDAALQYLFSNLYKYMNGSWGIDSLRTNLNGYTSVDKTNAMVDVVSGYLDGTKTEENVYEVLYRLFANVPASSLNATGMSGEHCYCQMTDFSSTDGVKRHIASAPWVHIFESTIPCSSCSRFCADLMMSFNPYSFGFRSVLASDLEFAKCAANEITINWTDATDEDIAANNAGMCTYGGDIRTPVRAATKPGKTFVGWKFDVTE